jgi:hypothetical protein
VIIRYRQIVATIAAALVVIAIPTKSKCQDAADQAAVKRAALDYLEGFYEGDSVKLARSIWPEVRKYGYYKNDAASPYSGSAMPYERFFSFAANVKAGRTKTPADPPKDVVIYEVQDQTAALKVTAYWGTDYLLLAKEKGRWMITHVLWQGPLKK